MKRRFQPAFTLIELMIVITIISILASISIIGATSVQRSTRDDARQSQSTVVAEALEKYYESNNEYPSVASITNQPINDVKQKLAIKDSEVLTFPTVTAGTSALVASNPTPARLTYVANTIDSNANSQCQTSINGYCDAFTLQYVKEADSNTVTINSRHNAVYAITDPSGPVVLSPPTQPAVTGTQVNSSLVRFTASSASCSIGSVEYKIRYNTSSSSTSSMPDWSTVAWGAATTKDVNPGSSTIFYSQSLARCVSGSESSADSSASVVDTLNFTPAGTAPSAPTVSASGISTSQISVSWTASSGSTPITYTVRYGTVSGTYGTTASGCSGISATTCSISGLAANTNYYIQVTATNSVSSAAGTSSAATQSVAAPSCSAAPSAPSVSASAGSSSSISVSWTTSSTPANCSAPTYTVKYGTSSGSYGTTACTVSSTTCNINSLSASTTYYIQVTAANSYGSSAGTSSASTPSAGTAPSSPVVSASRTAYNNVQLTWSASSGTAPITYSGHGCSSSPCNVSVAGLTSSYSFTITATNSFGSAQGSVTVPVVSLSLSAATTTIYGNAGLSWSFTNYTAPSGTTFTYSPANSASFGTGCDGVTGSSCTLNRTYCGVVNNGTIVAKEGSVVTITSSSASMAAVNPPSGVVGNLTVTNKYSNGWRIIWDDLPNATYYQQRITNPNGTVRGVESINSPSSPNSLSALASNNPYTHYIKGANCAGGGPENSRTINLSN